MAAAVQTNTARTIAVSAVLATTELAPVASGAARGGAIAAQVGTGFTSRVAEAAKTPLVVNEATIAKALEGSTMQTLQGRVSQPMVERYVRMLEAGKTPPPIQVADGVIVNGNHRYVAGRIFGVEPPTVPYPRPSTSVPKPIQQTTVDPADWGGH
jgi:hypothetical protein